MSKKMELDIENFGSINEAHIKLRKINIIAGVNGSGKSTASKLLFCLLYANSNDGYYLANEGIYDKYIDIISYWRRKLNRENKRVLDNCSFLISSRIRKDDDKFNEYLDKTINQIYENIESVDFNGKNEFINDLKDIEKLIDFNKDFSQRYFSISNVLLNSEFDFLEVNNYQDAHVSFNGNKDGCSVKYEIDFNGDKIGTKLNENYVDCLNFDDVIYVDSPSIFESRMNFAGDNESYHLYNLKKLIYKRVRSAVFDEEYYHDIISVQKKINEIIDGNIYYNKDEHQFRFKQGDMEYSMKNTASGVKQVSILYLLLTNKCLKENSFLFIDEPEINLHPEWQVKFAEVLIMLVKELNIYLYINSHSPQFIEALEVFAEKYNLIDESSFYLSKKSENNKFTFEEITYDTLNLLYDNLGDPYDIIDKIRAENIYNKIG